MTLAVFTEQELSGWGRYQPRTCRLTQPHTLDALRDTVLNGEGTRIARGLGRSYGDPAINPTGVVATTRLNRMLHFDASTGVLHAEAGVSLAAIIDHLLPRGFFLPTTPGTRFVTLGGAIAADVHGKNHHRDGSFGNSVQGIEVLLANGETVWASRDEHADLFAATVGGMGLTGHIISATVKLPATETCWCDVTYRRAESLDRAIELMEQTNAEYRHSVAWIDGLASGAQLGRSVLMLANDAPVGALPDDAKRAPLALPTRRRKSVPIDLPSCAVGPTTVRAFNALYYARHKDSRQLVDFDSFFYPLDAVSRWNRVYGKRGFVQYQALLPDESAREGLVELLELTSGTGIGSPLAVLKKSGPESEGLLGYLKPGYTLAIDLPNTGASLEDLTRRMDGVLAARGGRLYLAKDALMSADTFAAMYPNLPRFRDIKARYDPNQRFASSQARRVGIVESP